MAKESAVMASVFLGLLIVYIVYVFMLHPWERVSLYAKAGELIVSVSDCDTEHPISDVEVKFYTTDGALLGQADTDLQGLARFESLPQCFQIKASHTGDKYAGVCLGDGEERTVELCFDDPTVNPDIIYSTEYVGVVGAMSGEAISSKNYQSLSLSYPIESATASFPDYYLFSNILWNERMELGLNVNKSMTDSVILSFMVKSKKGDPVTIVRLSGVELFNDFVTAGDFVNVSIPKGLINESMSLSISCEFTGFFFWTTHDCELTNITVKQDYFLPLNPSKEYLFATSSLERRSDTTNIEFVANKYSDSGLKIYVNDYLIFNVNKLNAINYEGGVNSEELNFTDDENYLRFDLTPGGNASFSDIKLWFMTENATANIEEVSFTVPVDYLDTASYFEVHAYINEVLMGGDLILTLDDAIYEKPINRAGWTTIRIDKEDLDQSNTMLVSARDAKFEIQDLRLSYT